MFTSKFIRLSRITVYITAEFSAGTALTLKAAINELNPVCDKWYKIGVQLEVPLPNLRNITRDSMDPLCDTLDFWMRNGPSPSWRCLVDALKAPSVGEKQLAKTLEEKYCIPDKQSSCDESKGSVQAKGYRSKAMVRKFIVSQAKLSLF